MDFEDVQELIIQRLAQAAAVNKFSWFEVDVPLGISLPSENGSRWPYVLISFGGKSPVAESNQSIAGTLYDLKWTSIAFEVVAESPSDMRKVLKIIRRLYEGFSPDPSWGEFVERLSGDYTVLKPDSDLLPVRYSTGIVFNTNVDVVS